MEASNGSLDGLRQRLAGELIQPADAGYEDARSIFNSMIDRRPAAIAQCETADDVIAALAHARGSGLEVAIRSGGHSVAGAGLTDGGFVIDMRRMNAVEVDPAARTARVAGRSDLGRLRPRHPAPRADVHGRPGLDHRRRRAQPRRRLRLARAQVRARLRQPDFSPAGDRRRPRRHRVARARTRSSSGPCTAAAATSASRQSSSSASRSCPRRRLACCCGPPTPARRSRARIAT